MIRNKNLGAMEYNAYNPYNFEAKSPFSHIPSREYQSETQAGILYAKT